MERCKHPQFVYIGPRDLEEWSDTHNAGRYPATVPHRCVVCGLVLQFPIETLYSDYLEPMGIDYEPVWVPASWLKSR